MTHFAVNWLAVIVAIIASMALGFVWYMALSKQWLAAIGKTARPDQPAPTTRPTSGRSSSSW